MVEQSARRFPPPCSLLLTYSESVSVAAFEAFTTR